MDLCDYNAYELSEMLESRQISSFELVQSAIGRIKRVDKKLNSFITVCEEEAFDRAKQIDNNRADGKKLSVLAGIPIGVKDNIAVKNIRMTCGSKMLESFISPYNATVIDKLEQNGVVVVGKLNMDEFAMGSSTENSYFGAVKNPFDTQRVAGGSSGGCAAAVSSGECALAIGSDTGGSIRQPASFCGIVGLKPTYGCVSRYGLTAFASSFDQIGPMCRCVKDAAMLLDVIAGHDKHDSTSVDTHFGDYYKSLNNTIKGLRIGVPRGLIESSAQTEVLSSFDKALGVYEDCGALISDIEFENTQYALPAYYVISSAEASSNLARFDGVRYGFRAKDYKDLNDMYVKTRTQGFGDECKRRIMLGTFVLSEGYYDSYYLKALSAEKKIKQSFDRHFKDLDIIALPTSPETAFTVGSKRDDPVKMYQSDAFTVYANLAGLPAISIPCGYDKNGLPIGLQLIGNRYCEQVLLDAAFAFETNVGGFKKPRI